MKILRFLTLVCMSATSANLAYAQTSAPTQAEFDHISGGWLTHCEYGPHAPVRDETQFVYIGKPTLGEFNDNLPTQPTYMGLFLIVNPLFGIAEAFSAQSTTIKINFLREFLSEVIFPGRHDYDSYSYATRTGIQPLKSFTRVSGIKIIGDPKVEQSSYFYRSEKVDRFLTMNRDGSFTVREEIIERVHQDGSVVYKPDSWSSCESRRSLWKDDIKVLNPGSHALPQFKFSTVNAGTYTIGSPADEKGRLNDEPRRSVTLSRNYEIAQTEVTQLQWFSVMGFNPSKFSKSEYCPESFTIADEVSLCPNLPVEHVSWDDVQLFLDEYNRRAADGFSYRLPTEAEWEVAVRAGTDTPFFFGSDATQIGLYAWENDHYRNKQTHAAATKLPNSIGLFDVYGNVEEWVVDRYSQNPPSGQTDPIGPARSTSYVAKGGYFLSWAQLSNGIFYTTLRSAFRQSLWRGHRGQDAGFRLVRVQK